MRTRIVVVDDHPVFRYGLVSLLESEPDYEVAAQVGSADAALQVLGTLVPDLLLIDLSLGEGRSGLDLLEEVGRRFPQVRTLVVSIHNEAVYADRARASGAWGYVMKQAPGPVLKDAIRSVLAGRPSFTPKRPLGAPAEPGRTVPAPVSALSPREREILELLGKGRGVNEIATMLGLSVKTVGVHQDHLKARLGVANNHDLRRFAIELLASAGDGGRP